MLALQITPIGLEDTRTHLRVLRLGLAPQALNPIIGRSATNTIRAHLQERNRTHPNRLGGARTNFWLEAARATNWREVGDHVVVSINQVGIAQRYFGGTIVPVVAKFLAIPARAEAYGKRPSEFPDLEFVILGSAGPALVRRAASLIAIRRVKGSQRVIQRGAQGSEVMFWLKRSVTQRADPSVLPDQPTIETAVQSDVSSYVERLAQRGSDRL